MRLEETLKELRDVALKGMESFNELCRTLEQQERLFVKGEIPTMSKAVDDFNKQQKKKKKTVNVVLTTEIPDPENAAKALKRALIENAGLVKEMIDGKSFKQAERRLHRRSYAHGREPDEEIRELGPDEEMPIVAKLYDRIKKDGYVYQYNGKGWVIIADEPFFQAQYHQDPYPRVIKRKPKHFCENPDCDLHFTVPGSLKNVKSSRSGKEKKRNIIHERICLEDHSLAGIERKRPVENLYSFCERCLDVYGKDTLIDVAKGRRWASIKKEGGTIVGRMTGPPTIRDTKRERERKERPVYFCENEYCAYHIPIDHEMPRGVELVKDPQEQGGEMRMLLAGTGGAKRYETRFTYGGDCLPEHQGGPEMPKHFCGACYHALIEGHTRGRLAKQKRPYEKSPNYHLEKQMRKAKEANSVLFLENQRFKRQGLNLFFPAALPVSALECGQIERNETRHVIRLGEGLGYHGGQTIYLCCPGEAWSREAEVTNIEHITLGMLNKEIEEGGNRGYLEKAFIDFREFNPTAEPEQGLTIITFKPYGTGDHEKRQ